MPLPEIAASAGVCAGTGSGAGILLNGILGVGVLGGLQLCLHLGGGGGGHGCGWTAAAGRAYALAITAPDVLSGPASSGAVTPGAVAVGCGLPEDDGVTDALGKVRRTAWPVPWPTNTAVLTRSPTAASVAPMATTLGWATRLACRGSGLTPPVCVGSGIGAVTNLETTEGRYGLPPTCCEYAPGGRTTA